MVFVAEEWLQRVARAPAKEVVIVHFCLFMRLILQMASTVCLLLSLHILPNCSMHNVRGGQGTVFLLLVNHLL